MNMYDSLLVNKFCDPAQLSDVYLPRTVQFGFFDKYKTAPFLNENKDKKLPPAAG
jgi:hypothetical protein